MASVMYGIANCDTVKKARAWFTERGMPHHFHDYKKQGVTAEHLDRWIGQLGWEPLLNRKGTTWRKLDDATRSTSFDAPSARQLMLAHPSVIKRPVVEWEGGAITVGFDAAQWPRALP